MKKKKRVAQGEGLSWGIISEQDFWLTPWGGKKKIRGA